jgi:hypothetical protein|tara:strand:+ start:179 stop:826 length:648 start_codon:yes stop_codon:yes gene_type:complete
MATGLNTVNVYSIDEERLRFRVICCINAQGAGNYGSGNYDLTIPIPTSFANSHEYSSCRIRCDSFTAHIEAVGVAANTVWSFGGIATRQGSLELQLSVPSSQATKSSIEFAGNNPGAPTDPLITNSGFRQLLPLQYVPIGALAAAWVPANASSGGYISQPNCEPILCANPFGSRLRISLRDVFSGNSVFLANAAAIGADIGKYAFQFDVEMVANK